MNTQILSKEKLPSSGNFKGSPLPETPSLLSSYCVHVAKIVLALSSLAHSGNRPFSASEIADESDLSVRIVRRVLTSDSPLINEGLIKVKSGRGGGYWLDDVNTSMHDVVNAYKWVNPSIEHLILTCITDKSSLGGVHHG
ncbi:Rrf2 family transcriptional regulator [Vibrio mediterranei]|uniref:Rrf2 family transcriptional regulator n=1 Tax=Vibrio mediterranei TaxID=689 RepID=UPI0038CE6DF5